MTRSLYILGAAGTGKSTFTSELTERLELDLGPLEDLHSKPNAAGNLVTLRGHRAWSFTGPVESLIYLGVMREQFPGSDGLDRASSPTGEEWLTQGNLPAAILAEGATLATRRFLYGLHAHTELEVLAFRCDPIVHDIRLLSRGAGQMNSFVQSTITKTNNLVRDLEKQGAQVYWVDSDDPDSWEAGLLRAIMHLAG